LKEQAPS